MRGSQLGRTSDRRSPPARRRRPAAAAVLTVRAAFVAVRAAFVAMRAVLVGGLPVLLAGLVVLVAGLLVLVAGATGAEPAAADPGQAGVTTVAGPEQSETLVYALAVALAAVEQVTESDGRDLLILIFVLLVMRLFLTIQNWIDRQDPKLIAAPLTRDRYMEFRDPPPATGRRTPRRPADEGEDAR